uniref:Nicotinate phosphoribosyltransferase n=1 Tax=Candidatus Kentrum sp. FM TaxID=2126340 RepID=A0A450TVK8_9GAMM|nr:MAG: nicotinate phosphoribosyltransferase [Candidatus Kentron sp. FM]VFJ73043.1 MAG: nicotinate phosphoribosyltransferase [Candidatus Kentron sp. FM]VFK19398.1 MAG: nicotinate phosphoribosyltransferase [Candidatus Kentron sp. FM]
MKENIRKDSGPEARERFALFTDLYELLMAQAYFEEEMTDTAVFSLFVRRLPARRNFLLACGLETVLGFLEALRFSGDDIAYLDSTGRFSQGFLAWLRDFRFTGDIHAVPEGTPVFANEPILEVVAPLAQAQLVETFLMNRIHLQTMLASKAQRVVSAAAGRRVVDFASRRMHGLDAALEGARGFYIGGVSATSNVLAGKRYGLPIAGTMAHSYIQSHEDEMSAFRAFARLYSDTVLLVDTYDTLEGVRKLVKLATSPGEGLTIGSIRLDSGDLSALSRQARRILDEAGLDRIGIFVSGGLDEDSIARLVSSNAPIDGFGVGTEMGVSGDAPSLDIVYKLCEYAGQGRLKLSSGKPVLPGRKQVFRMEEGGRDVRDVIGRVDEDIPGRPLLHQVMGEGRRLPAGIADPESIRGYAGAQIGRLPPRVREIAAATPPYSVEVSAALSGFQKETAERSRG